MDDETTTILNMLSQGKISAEEAEKLLEAVGGAPQGELPPEAGETMAKLGDMIGKGFMHRGHGPAPCGVEAAEDGGEQTFQANPDTCVEIKSVAGDLSVSGLPAGEKAVVTADGAVKVTESGERWTVHGGPLSGDLDVRIPPVRRVEVDHAGGDVSVRGVRADVRIHSKGGDLDMLDCAGRLEVTSLGGNCTVQGDTRALRLDSKGGNVRVGVLTLTEGEHSVQSMGGNVEVVLSPESSVRVDVRSVGGGVHCDFPSEERGGGFIPIAKKSGFTIGSGQAELSISSMGGNVTIRRGTPAAEAVGAAAAEER